MGFTGARPGISGIAARDPTSRNTRSPVITRRPPSLRRTSTVFEATKGNTTMMLEFDRLVMPDGRRAPIHAEIVELYHAPSNEKVDVEGAIESGGRGRTSIEHTATGAGARA